MRLPPRRELQREFWRLIRAGWVPEDASAGLGLSARIGRHWMGNAGGMPPMSLDSPAPSSGLTIQEREKIAVLVARDESIRAIARSINRSPSTVLRELRRNLRHQRYRGRRQLAGSSPARPGRDWTYSPHLAQQRADRRAARPKVAKLAESRRLHDEVQERLEAHHSPEQIANRLRVDFPDDPEMWVSHETIYQSLYVQGRGALRRDLHKCLRTGRAIRKPRRKTGQRRGRIAGMVNIADRPPEVEDRAVPGHWEGDLIVGRACQMVCVRGVADETGVTSCHTGEERRDERTATGVW
jgi:transposase, IS30 family